MKALSLVLALAPCVLPLTASAQRFGPLPANTMRAHFINVGQGRGDGRARGALYKALCPALPLSKDATRVENAWGVLRNGGAASRSGVA